MHTEITGTTYTFIHGISNRTHPHSTLNTSITFNKKITTTPTIRAHCFINHFTNPVGHVAHKTNSSVNRVTQIIQGYNITLTTAQVQEAIK